MRARLIWALLIVMAGSLLFPVIAQASSISASPSAISDTIYQDDINQNNTDLPWFYLDTTTATTTISVTITQTGSWSVKVTVSISSVPTGADTPPNTALEVSPDGGGNWYQSGDTIYTGYCGSPPCTDSFTVWYRLNLAALGDGARGDYVFNVTYTLNAPDGSSTADVTVTITADKVASITIFSQPTVYDSSIDQSDLTARYFGGSGGFARFSVHVYAISDYAVLASVSVTGCDPALGCQADSLIQADVYSVSSDDESCVVDQWGWQTLPTSGTSAPIFTGCNTMSGTPYVNVRLALRLDLASLGDISTAASLSFQITVTVVEQ